MVLLYTVFVSFFFFFLVLTADCLLFKGVSCSSGQSGVSHAVPADAQGHPVGFLRPGDDDTVIAAGTSALGAVGTATDLIKEGCMGDIRKVYFFHSSRSSTLVHAVLLKKIQFLLQLAVFATFDTSTSFFSL